MKIFIFIVLSLSVSAVLSDVSAITASKESIALLKNIASSDLAQEWGKKLGDRFTKIGSISKKFGKYAGPVGDIISFALTIVGENQDQTEEYLKNITKQLDKIDAKLDAISDQIKILDSKLELSTKKIISELKFRDYLKHLEDLAASKEHFESIIYSFTSNSASFLHQLDKYIEDYRQQGSDSKLINTLDSGTGITHSIIDDLISLSRSYEKEETGYSGSSTMKTVYDVYIAAFMSILKSNIILESAVNLKTAITGQYYEEDRRYNHYRRAKIFENFFASLKKAFDKLENNDMNAFIDFSVNGDKNSVRMINVLQIFWENEDKLSSIDTCTDDCEHFQNRQYIGGGCNGGVRDCKFGVTLHHTERYLRQDPQVDRIYEGYVLNHKYYGHGNDVEDKMEKKQSYLRVFVNCHVCKCVCDQYSYSESVRKIYSGKVSAPDGYVVTGMKFVERNKAIYPQIQVGKLLPMATVDQSSVYWLDLPSDRDFVTFGYSGNDFKLADPAQLKFSNAVVTGVQVERTYNGASWSIFRRELADFNRGILGNEDHVKITSSVNYYRCSDLIPGLSSNGRFTIDNSGGVTFGISNEDEDAGQSFVPYFDGNKVTFDIKSPLSGITLVRYTNSYNYAGYIRPFIRNLDYRKLFSTSYQAEEFFPDNNTAYEVDDQKKNVALKLRSNLIEIYLLACIITFICNILKF